MEEIALIQYIAGSSPLAAVVLGAAVMIARVMLRSQKPMVAMIKQVEAITQSLADIQIGLHKLNNTMARLIAEREHDRRDIEILRDALTIISDRVDNTNHK